MQPAKEFSAAREHFGETSTLNFFFPSSLCDAISKAEPLIEPCAFHTGIIQTCDVSLSSVLGFSSSSIVMK